MTDMHKMSEEAYWRNMAEVQAMLARNIADMAELADRMAKDLAQQPVAEDDPCKGCIEVVWCHSVHEPCMYRHKCVTYHLWEDGR